ncbi:hypothetical protein [Streptomyces sp. NPDC001880]
MRGGFPVRALTTLTAADAVLAGLLGSAPQARAATTVPSWLIPLHCTDDANGSHRACTGITLSRTRTLATPDRGDVQLRVRRGAGGPGLRGDLVAGAGETLFLKPDHKGTITPDESL